VPRFAIVTAVTAVTAVTQAPVRVMVVDDHPIWREGVARDLAEEGYDVVAAVGEGAQAVRVAGAARPDVVVLDLQLPDLS
jgi:DNA-binding NarL/FixJ family response regulator